MKAEKPLAATPVEAIVILPPPRCGKPFRLKGCLQKLWFNETVAYRRNPNIGLHLYRWECPFGEHGEPQIIDGKWYWVKTNEQCALREPSEDADNC